MRVIDAMKTSSLGEKTAPPGWTRRHWLARAGVLALGASGAQPATAGPSYPARSIALWVPWPAGGATDISLRWLGRLAGIKLNQTIVVRNRAGAGGSLAMPILQQSEPDGYTIAQMPQPVFRLPFLHRVPWDPIADVTPILQIASVAFGILVAAGSPFRSLDDVFDFAKRHPGELTVATNGVGTTPHRVLEQLFTARGLGYIHAPYKGTAEQINAITGGQVMAGVNSTGFGPAVDAGRLRLLALFTARRSRHWPEVPTLRELGFDIVATSPYGLAGPRGLPPEVVGVLHDAFRWAMFEPGFAAELARYDQDIAYLGPDDYARSCREAYGRERADAGGTSAAWGATRR